MFCPPRNAFTVAFNIIPLLLANEDRSQEYWGWDAHGWFGACQIRGNIGQNEVYFGERRRAAARRTLRLPSEGEKRRSARKLDAFRASSPSTGRETKVSTSSNDFVSQTAFTSRCVSVQTVNCNADTKSEANNARAERDFIGVRFQSSTRRLMTREAAFVCCALVGVFVQRSGTLRNFFSYPWTNKKHPTFYTGFHNFGRYQKRPSRRLELCHRNFQPS